MSLKQIPVLLFITLVAGVQQSCTPEVTSTCAGCEFVEYEYTESLSIISGFDESDILIEQPYSDWEQQAVEQPEITFSDMVAPDSTIILRLTIDAGSGSEEGRALHEIGYDGEQFRIWYGSTPRRYFKGKSASDTPRPPYYRIKEIEIRTPYQISATVEFNVRYPSQ